MRWLGWIVAAAAALPLAASAQGASPRPLPSNCTAVSDRFIGTICTPHGAGKHPAVILLGGSEGGDILGPAFGPVFSEHGYVAVSVAYFQVSGLPQVLVNVPVDTVQHAIAAIEARPDVDSAHIGILGGSKGGELALLAASTYPQIKAVVADVPSPFAWFGLGQYDSAEGCSWTLGGKTLPCVPPNESAEHQIGADFMSHKPMDLRTLYDASMNADPAAVKAAFFPLDRIAGPVLCLSADDDRLWDSPAYCKMAISYLQQHHHSYNDRAIGYPDAGHTFLWAVNGPKSALTTVPLPGGASMELGGTTEGDVAAAQKAWPQIWTFLSQALGSH